MLCPLCSTRKARRACPAVGAQICAVCCGTKRLTEIRCPPDCGYLASAREHPPAAAVRQQQRDLTRFVHGLRDLNRRQSQLLLALASIVARYEPTDLHAAIDDDVVEAAATLAATFETASRGVIYEHRSQSLPAERLAAALRPMLIDAGKGGGSAFERDAAVVLRRIEEAAREARASEPGNRRAYLDLLDRVMRKDSDASPGDGAGTADPAPLRLIVP